MAAVTRLTLSSEAIEDHLSRLYLRDPSEEGLYVHVDLAGAEIRLRAWTARTVALEASEAAVRDLRADADYQREIAASDGDRPTARRWRRVLERLELHPGDG